MKPVELGPSPIDFLNQQFLDDPTRERVVPRSTLASLLHVGMPRLTRIINSSALQTDPQYPKKLIITGERLVTLKESVKKGITR